MPLHPSTLDARPHDEPAAVPGASALPERRRARRWRIAAPVVAVVALALAAAACAPAGAPGSGVTGDMVQAANQDRAAAGLGGLAWDGGLARLAQGHAEEIAASGSLWHSNLGAWLGPWRALGENLYMGPPGSTAWAAEDAWMASPPHRANLLNGGYNRIGLGVKVDGAGRVWMVA